MSKLSVCEFLLLLLFTVSGKLVFPTLLKISLSLRAFVFSFPKRFMFTISPSLIFLLPFELYKRRLLWSGNNFWPDMQFAS